MKRLLFIVFFVGLVSPAWAINGNKLLSDCSNELPIAEGYCMGYISGIIDALSSHDKGKDALSFCVPEQVVNKQVYDVVIKYLNENPENRHFRASIHIEIALSKVWPCKE